MNNPLSTAVRATAAALAVFATVATLSSMVSIAEPQRGELMAQVATRHAAATPRQAMVLAQATADARSH
jgi:hypothetical protein